MCARSAPRCGPYTVQFRDWLRAIPAARRAYENAKQHAADAHASDVDFDDYTRAKAAFFDEVQAEYEQARQPEPMHPGPQPSDDLPFRSSPRSVALSRSKIRYGR
jgi:GrpB protein